MEFERILLHNPPHAMLDGKNYRAIDIEILVLCGIIEKLIDYTKPQEWIECI